MKSILVPAGGQGFKECGCHIVVGMDSTPERALAALYESWVDLANDSNDALGNQFAAADSGRTNSAWTLP